MKIIGSRKVDWLILVVTLLCIYTFVIDLTYAGYVDFSYCINETYWLENLLGSLGFTRCNAVNLLNSSLGVALTLVTTILNMGYNIFSHSERKVFGLYLGNFSSCDSLLYSVFLNASIVFPVLIIVTINLEFCGISYMLLFSCYLATFCNYKDLQSSYDDRLQRSKVVSKLLTYVEDKKIYIDNNMTDFDVAVEDIHKGIKEMEGWNNAWLLFQEFVNRVMEYDFDQCFMLSSHFFGIAFNVSEGKNIDYELIYIKRFIDMMGVEKKEKKRTEKKGQKDESEMEYIVLWGLLCSVAVKWDSNAMQRFLEWFAYIAERSHQHILMNSGELDHDEIQRQSAIILVMLEYWLYMYDDAVEFSCECVKIIYKYGQNFFNKKNEEFLHRLDYLFMMGKSKDEPDYNAVQMLLMDFKYNSDNSLIRTILKYNV